MHPIEPIIVHETDKNAQPEEPSALLTAGKRVQVQPGQSWWKLAELYLGNGALWPELRKLNADVDDSSDLLEAGATVVVPDVQKTTEVAKTSLNPASSITVQKGDSLWSLARKYLGRGSSWIYLAQANPQIVDFTHLAIGTTVQLPSQEPLNSNHK